MKAVWLILAVVLALVEAATVQFVSIWFVCGAVCAMFSAFFTDNLIIQLIVFVLSAIVFLLVFRKTAIKGLKSKIPTNSDSFIGKSAILKESVDNDLDMGTLVINGVIWTARSENGERIEAGTKVKIVKIEGIKLIVRKED